VSEGALPGLREAALRVQEEDESESKTCGRKERTIQHMMMTTFWHPDGTPMSAQQFMELLFGRLPDFFQGRGRLRAIWSAPDTRKKLLQGLAEKGLAVRQLARDAEDHRRPAREIMLFRCAAHVLLRPAALTPRRTRCKGQSHYNIRLFNSKSAGLPRLCCCRTTSAWASRQLDQEKLTALITAQVSRLIADAVADLGKADEIREGCSQASRNTVSAASRCVTKT